MKKLFPVTILVSMALFFMQEIHAAVVFEHTENRDVWTSFGSQAVLLKFADEMAGYSIDELEIEYSESNSGYYISATNGTPVACSPLPKGHGRFTFISSTPTDLNPASSSWSWSFQVFDGSDCSTGQRNYSGFKLYGENFTTTTSSSSLTINDTSRQNFVPYYRLGLGTIPAQSDIPLSGNDDLGPWGNIVKFLLVPPKSTLDLFTENIPDAIRAKAPFGYMYEVTDRFSNINSDATQADFVVPIHINNTNYSWKLIDHENTDVNNIGETLKPYLAWAIWIGLIGYVWVTLRDIQL